MSEYGDKPHDTEDEDWEMRSVGRHLYKVLMDHTDLDAKKKTVVGAPECDRVEAYRLLTRQYDPFSYDVAAQMLENILVVGRADPKDIDQFDQVRCSKSCTSACMHMRRGLVLRAADYAQVATS